MKSLIKHIIFFILSITMAFAGKNNPQESAHNESILLFLPKSEELEEWFSVGEPERYEGEDLFLFINGGAEIYYEYGFNQVISQEYESTAGKKINLELYQMDNSAAAYGMYTFKSGKDGREIQIGDEGRIEDYYLNFWKGKYLITLIGLDPEKETASGLLTLAKVIDSKIKEKGKKPLLLNLLPDEDLNGGPIKYIKGLLGLYNNYMFDSENIFGISEGLIANYENYRLFVFAYKNSEKCNKWFQHAVERLEKNPRFSDKILTDSLVTMKDKKETPLYLKKSGKFIFIALGGDKKNAVSVFERINR